VTLPKPIPGLVIRYSYLWSAGHEAGNEEGSKDRPAAIVAAIRMEATGDLRVLVVPVTHSGPVPGETAIELPAKVKRRLGLDEQRSWIIPVEANEFTWPGPDLRLVPGSSDRFDYGVLPPRLFEQVRQAFVAALRGRQLKRIPRTE
jgi:hypothetical protein